MQLTKAVNVSLELLKSGFKAFASHFGKAAAHHEMKAMHHENMGKAHGDMMEGASKMAAACKALHGVHKGDHGHFGEMAEGAEKMTAACKAMVPMHGKAASSHAGMHKNCAECHGGTGKADKAFEGVDLGTLEFEVPAASGGLTKAALDSSLTGIDAKLEKSANEIEARVLKAFESKFDQKAIDAKVEELVNKALEGKGEPVVKGLHVIARGNGVGTEDLNGGAPGLGMSGTEDSVPMGALA